VIVLILVAVLWIAVLVPTAVSKLRERRSAGSIGRFHDRLDLLERTGPKLVEPAYRLTGTDWSRPRSDPMVVVAPPPLPARPNLTLVPPPDDDLMGYAEELDMGGEARVETEGEYEDEDVGDVVLDAEIAELRFAEEPDDDLVEPPPVDRRSLAAMKRRRAARRRRRDIFGVLCGLTALCGLLGLVPALRGAWYVAGALFGLLVAFVGLAVYGQRVEAERDHLARLQRSEQGRVIDEGEPSAIVKYLSEDELLRYREALAEHYEGEDRRFVAQA
jgi:hypothetical protein